MSLALAVCLPLMAADAGHHPGRALPFDRRVQHHCESTYFHDDYLEDAAVTVLLDSPLPSLPGTFSYGAIAEIDWMLRRQEIVEDLAGEILEHAVNGRILIYRVQVEPFTHEDGRYYRVVVVYEA